MSARTFLTSGKKIVAIGRNFSEHAKELGNAVPKSPFFFLKPTSSYVANGGTIEIPTGCDVHHEIELAVVMGKETRDCPASQAMDNVAGFALAIDCTARNLQNEAKKKGLPWSAAKGFDTFTPISEFVPKDSFTDTNDIDLWLKVNDKFRQQGNTKDMIFKIPSLIEYVSSIMKLEAGDVLLTGTPSGVFSMKHGDVVTAGMKPGKAEKDIVTLKLNVADRKGLYKPSE
ncbi:Acylpyruvase fahd1, mitochondrial [Mucor flavus]|uniref:Acylpyruvase fahd1, mitochondrial n=1 Tax=Mucor flavus TaxID=439312 RepID=A0ABP9ZAW5_9FUNG